MNTIDVLLVLWFVGAGISGFRTGFIYKVGSLIGLVVGIWIASRLTANWTSSLRGNPTQLVGVFFFILTLVRMVCGWGAMMIQRIFNILAIIPGLKLLNRIAGAVLSAVLSVMSAGVILLLFMRLAPVSNWTQSLEAAPLASTLVRVARIAEPLLSDRLTEFRSGLEEQK